MHRTFFRVKRAFHTSVQFGLQVLRPFGITPARFDLMFELYRVWRTKVRRGEIGQTDLRRVLGVSAPTVSRMLASLEQLGLVRRRPHRWDRRRLVVRLTLRGLACVLRASWATMTGFIELAVRSIVSPDTWYGYESHEDVRTLEALLQRMSKSLGDGTRFGYDMPPVRPVFFEHPVFETQGSPGGGAP